jgi:beta-lactamase class A
MCSTFKVIAAAFLAKVDKGEDSLSGKVVIDESNLVSYSQLTETRTGGAGMSMAEICETAITLSDNTAGNTILESIGGPSGVTQFARAICDQISRLDRWETQLNEAAIGDPRDTTSPKAMMETLQKLLFGSTLSQASKRQLQSWMTDNKTGDAKLRAGLPSDWIVGDKTGGGANGTMAGVAFVLVPDLQPVIVAVCMTETATSFGDRNAGIADIARALKQALA